MNVDMFVSYLALVWYLFMHSLLMKADVFWIAENKNDIFYLTDFQLY